MQFLWKSSISSWVQKKFCGCQNAYIRGKKKLEKSVKKWSMMRLGHKSAGIMRLRLRVAVLYQRSISRHSEKKKNSTNPKPDNNIKSVRTQGIFLADSSLKQFLQHTRQKLWQLTLSAWLGAVASILLSDALSSSAPALKKKAASVRVIVSISVRILAYNTRSVCRY